MRPIAKWAKVLMGQGHDFDESLVIPTSEPPQPSSSPGSTLCPISDRGVCNDPIIEVAARLGIPTKDAVAPRSPLNRAATWLHRASLSPAADGKLAVVAPYFNPAGYSILTKNYQAFLRLIGAVPLYPVEISFGKPWVAQGLRLQGGERHVLWQKERLINLAVASLPAKYDRIAWLDGDIVLTDPNWYTAVEKALDQHPVLQIGDTIVVEGRQHKMAAAHAFLRWAKLGYAWAARRELFPLYDAAVIGGGDLLCAYGWLGRAAPDLTPGQRWVEHYQAWARRAHSRVKGKIGYVPGTLVHLDHGSRAGRQYHERYRLLEGLDPDVDLLTDANGLWAWSDTAAAARHRVLTSAYFASRQDG